MESQREIAEVVGDRIRIGHNPHNDIVLSSPFTADESIHRQVASAINLVVQLKQRRDGTRRGTHVTKFVGIDDQRGGIPTKDIFVLENGNGQWMTTRKLRCFPWSEFRIAYGCQLRAVSFPRTATRGLFSPRPLPPKSRPQ